MQTLMKAIEEKGITRNQLAMKAGISPSDLYTAIAGKKEFFPAWRKRVAAVLGVAETELFPEIEAQKTAPAMEAPEE